MVAREEISAFFLHLSEDVVGSMDLKSGVLETSKKHKSGTMGRSAEHHSSSVSFTINSNIHPEK